MRHPHPTATLGLAALSGLCWGLAPPTFFGGVAVLLGSVAMAGAVRGRVGADLAAGAVAGTVWFACALRWVPGTLQDYGATPPAWGWPALVLVQAVPVALVWATAGWARSRGLPTAVALGLAWMAWAEAFAFLQVMPLTPAILWSGTGPYLWPAALGGVALVSGAVVAVGAALRHPGGLLALGVWAVVGAVWVKQPLLGEPLTVAWVQPNTGAFDGRRASTADARADHLDGLVRDVSAASPDVVLLPESAWPYDIATRPPPEDWPPTIVGTHTPTTNRLQAWPPSAGRDAFDKRWLAPFTERAILGFGDTTLQAGRGPRRLAVHDVVVAPLICIEDAIPQAHREAVAADPDVILAAAHDGWTGPRQATAWHGAVAAFVAVSTGIPVVRAGLSGPSGLYLPDGSVHHHTPWHDGDVAPMQGRAFVAELAGRRDTGWPSGADASLGWTVLAWLLLGALALRRPIPQRPTAAPEAGGDRPNTP